jgi:hypothetical protein
MSNPVARSNAPIAVKLAIFDFVASLQDDGEGLLAVALVQ